MRWKLLITASLLAAFVGVGLTIVMFTSLLNVPMNATLLDVLTSPLSPLLYCIPPITLAGIFVYRHTARRRKLQALITVLLASGLICASFLLAALFLTGRIRP